MIHDIAIDGPAASGKTVVGRLLAQRLGWRFLDTGVMYRAVTWLALERGVSPEDSCGLGELARAHPIRLSDGVPSGGISRPVETAGTRLGPELYQSRVDNNVSDVSKHSAVRRALVAQQREIAELAAAVGGIVMIGRDIGTVVLPDAGLKVFLTASAEERARRRWREMRERGQEIEMATVQSEIEARDVIDSSRDDSPLRPASDAWQLDTSGLSIEETVDGIMRRMEGG
jgi:cytidylate kinase